MRDEESEQRGEGKEGSNKQRMRKKREPNGMREGKEEKTEDKWRKKVAKLRN